MTNRKTMVAAKAPLAIAHVISDWRATKFFLSIKSAYSPRKTSKHHQANSFAGTRGAEINAHSGETSALEGVLAPLNMFRFGKRERFLVR
jgi:hypothetical protein